MDAKEMLLEDAISTAILTEKENIKLKRMLTIESILLACFSLIFFSFLL